MKAVILAAGRGKRMGVLTKDIPKSLIVLRGKTFLDHIFDSLPAVVTEVIVVVGYKSEAIKKYLGDRHKGRTVRYVTQTNYCAGPAQAFLLARHYLEKSSERFFIIHSDELPSAKEMRECLSHRFSWLCHALTTSIPTAVVRVNSAGRLLSVIERRKVVKAPFISDGGVILVDRRIFLYKPRKHSGTGEYYLTAMMAPFLKQFPVHAVLGAPDLYFSNRRDVDRYNKNK